MTNYDQLKVSLDTNFATWLFVGQQPFSLIRTLMVKPIYMEQFITFAIIPLFHWLLLLALPEHVTGVPQEMGHEPTTLCCCKQIPPMPG